MSYKQFDPHAGDSAIVLAEFIGPSPSWVRRPLPLKVHSTACPGNTAGYSSIKGLVKWNCRNHYGRFKKAHKKAREVYPNFDSRDGANTGHGQTNYIVPESTGLCSRNGYLDCGHMPCEQCDVTLTYHQYTDQLKCHYCGYHIAVPQKCHACGLPNLSTKGMGTQQIQEQVTALFLS